MERAIVIVGSLVESTLDVVERRFRVSKEESVNTKEVVERVFSMLWGSGWKEAPPPRYVYKHYRVAEDGLLHHYQRGESIWTPSAKGGFTECFIYADLGAGEDIVGRGWALCSEKDNFCYRIGRRIARGRAERSLRDGKIDPLPRVVGTVDQVRSSLDR